MVDYEYPMISLYIKQINSLIVISTLKKYITGRPDKIVNDLKIAILVVSNFKYRSNILAISTGSEWSSKNKINKRAVRRVLRLFIKEKIIKLKMKGYRNKGYKQGYASIYQTTKKFHKLFGKTKKEEFSYNLEGCPNIIIEEGNKVEKYYFNELKSKKGQGVYLINVKTGKIKEEFLQTHKELRNEIRRNIQKYCAEIYYLNKEYFSKFKLGFTTSRYLSNRGKMMSRCIAFRRKFNKEELGRLCTFDVLSYQNIKKEDRKYLTINGCKTAEVDYSAMHVNLIYYLAKKKTKYKDQYNPIVKELIGRKDDELRDVIKKAMLTIMNAESKKSAKKSIFDYRDKENKEYIHILKKHRINFEKLDEAVEKVHKPIKKQLYTNKSHTLMKLESEIILNVLQQIKHKHLYHKRTTSCYGMPLHDSIICRVQDASKVKKIMKQIYKLYTGNQININIK